MAGLIAQAMALQQATRFGDAERVYRQVLSRDPDHADALHLLGLLAHQSGHGEAGLPYIARAIELRPRLAPAHNHMGLALKGLGRLAEAEVSFQRAIKLNPKSADAYNNLGLTQRAAGHIRPAVASFQKALKNQGNYVPAVNNLGSVLLDLERYPEAEARFRKGIRLQPTNSALHNNLGHALTFMGRFPEAVDALEQARSMAPNDVEVLHNLGIVWKELKNAEKAEEVFQQALSLASDDTRILSHMVELKQRTCAWNGLDMLAERLVTGLGQPGRLIMPFQTLSIAATPEQQWRCATQYSAGKFQSLAQWSGDRPFLHRNGPRKPLTIGYLSPDFRTHPVASLSASMYQAHDRSRVKVVGYALCADDGSDVRQRIVAGCDQFVELHGKPVTEAAQRIHRDGVDILVDLAGHTKNAQTGILALRPAPIQAAYLGYPGTTGATFIDYVVADAFVAPHPMQRHYTEKLVHLPGCFQVNDSHRPRPNARPSRTEYGLPEHGFVFCSFNLPYKITPTLFDVWMDLLKDVPDSVLWLSTPEGAATDNLRAEAEARGVAGARIVRAKRVPDIADHFARIGLADLFLDTHPYNAHTTTSDALWAGCPLLTCVGETYASRVAGSLLHAVGLPGLITHSLAEYKAKALDLAAHPEQLAAMRDHLVAARDGSPLYDCDRLVRCLESAYEAMWATHAAGQPPTPITIPEPT